jgi:hypothetical protein
MLDKQKWVEFFELAQAKARAPKQRRGETRRRPVLGKLWVPSSLDRLGQNSIVAALQLSF